MAGGRWITRGVWLSSPGVAELIGVLSVAGSSLLASMVARTAASTVAFTILSACRVASPWGGAVWSGVQPRVVIARRVINVRVAALIWGFSLGRWLGNFRYSFPM